MVCNGSGCKSNCYRDDEVGFAEVASYTQSAERTKSGAAEANPIANTLCIRCKVNEAISGYGGIDDGRFCVDCFRNNLFGKFRFAVTSNTMIMQTDKVLVAFSGGPSPRVALQFFHDMQHRVLKNFDASRDRSLPVFGAGVVFIDESSVSSIPSNELEKAVKDISSILHLDR